MKQSNKQRSAEKKAAAIAAERNNDITKYVLIGSVVLVMLVFLI